MLEILIGISIISITIFLVIGALAVVHAFLSEIYGISLKDIIPLHKWIGKE